MSENTPKTIFKFKKQKGSSKRRLYAISGDDEEVIANFVAKIVEERHQTALDGSKEIFLTLVGMDENGNRLERVTMPIEEYDRGNWPRSKWGGIVNV